MEWPPPARLRSLAARIGDIIGDDAIDLLTSRLITALQIVQHLTLAFDDLEPRLTRHGYTVRSLALSVSA